MHKMYAKDGLVILMVDVDPSLGRDSLARIDGRVRKLVREHSLEPMTHLILDESDELIDKKLGYGATPAVYVFDRLGKWRRFVDEEGSNHKAIEELVVKLLKAPAR
jgi:hypothetical protein